MGKLTKAKGPIHSDPAVLFVDDEPAALNSFVNLFRRDPVRVLKSPSGLHALALLKEESIVVVVSDYWMSGMSGVALLDEVARLYPHTGRLLLTGRPDAEIVLEAKHHKTLTKDMDPDLIRRVVLREVKRHGG